METNSPRTVTSCQGKCYPSISDIIPDRYILGTVKYQSTPFVNPSDEFLRAMLYNAFLASLASSRWYSFCCIRVKYNLQSGKFDIVDRIELSFL